LKLLPTENARGGELSFTLLDQVPLTVRIRVRYTALSYCAGDPKKAVPILINGVRFNAFANLGHALKEVMMYWEKNGRKKEEEYLWADQICIGQSNTYERSHQVGMMKDIYSGAERVLVCLAESENSGVGLQWAIEVQKWLQEESEPSLRAKYFDENVECSPWWQGMNAFLQLLLRSWWTRAWVC
jgi:Heterokaryon incompatibility protein (HET)